MNLLKADHNDLVYYVIILQSWSIMKLPSIISHRRSLTGKFADKVPIQITSTVKQVITYNDTVTAEIEKTNQVYTETAKYSSREIVTNP